MSTKLHLNTKLSQDGTPLAATPTGNKDNSTPTPVTAGGSKPAIKLKLSSQPPTPAALEPTPSKPAATKKQRAPSSKKRAANDDISPVAKSAVPPLGRKPSIKLHTAPRPPPPSDNNNGGSITPVSAGGNRIKIGLGPRKPSGGPKIRSINVKRPPPERVPGVGYDSEDSEAEADPAIQQSFILRMAPGEDCDFLHEAIANGKVGTSLSEGGAEVSIRFLDAQNHRAVVSVRGRKYAAALVDLPCIVETMKSWDRKSFWKVADVCQILLVLGRCNTDDEARSAELPPEVDKASNQYPHGLTPPMHAVRKRRFRPRPTYKDMANVDEEVERIMNEDEETTRLGGQVTTKILDRSEAERQRSYGEDDDEDEDMDADGEAVETVEREDGYGAQNDDFEEEEEDQDDEELAGGLQAMFDKLGDDEGPQQQQQPSSSSAANASATASGAGTAAAAAPAPRPLADQGPSMAAVESAIAPTPVSNEDEESDEDAQGEEEEEDDDAGGHNRPSRSLGGAGGAANGGNATTTDNDDDDESDEDDDDDDDDDDEDSPDVMDEDAQQKAAERAQQLEEVADLQREVEVMRARVAAQKNLLIREKLLAQQRRLEEDLRAKRAVFGLEEEDDD